MAQFGKDDLFVSPAGRDDWSGRLAEPSPDGKDGPLATLAAARDAIRRRARETRPDGERRVWLRGGRYPLAETVIFGPEDSGPVVYAAYPGERPVLDGGVRIEGWREETVGGVRQWRVQLPDVAAGGWYFRQLFVDGGRRPRASLPKGGGCYRFEDVPGVDADTPNATGNDTFRCAPGHMRRWENLTDVEAVAYHYWMEERLPIVSYDETTRLAKSSRKSRYKLTDEVSGQFALYRLENVGEALTEPGEWYLDRRTGVLTYLPRDGETLARTSVYAPRLRQLVRFAGDPDAGRYVEGVRLVGLTFEHADWELPAHTEPRRPGELLASSGQGAPALPGVIQWRGARGCAIEDCAIRHIGTYGIRLDEGCTGNRIVGNVVSDMGGGGIMTGGADASGPLTGRTGDNRITDNHIFDGGRVFASAVGILSRHAYGTVIAHNRIHDLSYTGISCGWTWHYGDNVSRDNRIEYNHIHHLGRGELSDLGGIYLLGVQPGTVVRGNLIHDIVKRAYGGWAIYLDEATSHVLVEGNVCLRSNNQLFHVHCGRENIVRHNVFACGEEGQIVLSKVEGHNAFTFMRNIVIGCGGPMLIGGYAGGVEKKGFISDLNLFWDVRAAEGEASFGANGVAGPDGRFAAERTFTLAQWREMGGDRHSVWADPKLADLDRLDFSLAPDSPAYALGIEPPQVDRVGPRPPEQRDEEGEAAG